MDPQEPLLLESLLEESKDRNNLVPLWMKIFALIFMITGLMAIISLFASLAGANVDVSLYGLESTNQVSPTGILIVLLFLFKGIVAFGLWTQKGWAVNFGLADAVIGIAICGFVMAVSLATNNGLNLRLELAGLIPYLIRLQKIRPHW